ncbi:MAG: hypothetical protein ACLQOO_24040 [Terriglobia bacterium]
MVPSDMLDHMLDHAISFVLWSLVALIGLIRLVTETYPRPARRSRPAHQIAGAGLLLLGVIAASPHGPRTLKEIFLAAPHPNQRVLAQDQTISGIVFQAGSIVGVKPDGDLVSAELKRPHTIGGLVVIGHVEFPTSTLRGGTFLTLGTLTADQEMPNSGGVWCSSSRPFSTPVSIANPNECELARVLIRDGARIPAGSQIQYWSTGWIVDLGYGGGPASIEGLSVPAGWTVSLDLEPAISLSNLRVPSNPTPETQLWVEIHGVKLTGMIYFPEKGIVDGELWQDATIE